MRLANTPNLAGCGYGTHIAPIAKLNSKGAAAMSDYLNEQIGYEVQGTAAWRREKAAQFPHDERNLRAAEELERLAEQVADLEDSEIEREIRETHERLIEASKTNHDNEVWTDISDAVRAGLRSIGFQIGYAKAEEFLKWYHELLQGRLYDLLDEAVPGPDLDEQAENDPAVKVAKRAYEQAFAKARAEARKRL
jgi:hypothetical protein